MFPHVEQTDPILNVKRSVQWRSAKPHQINNFRENVDINVEMPR